MRDLGTATADEMVLAFLKAEIDSLRFAYFYHEALRCQGWCRRWLIDQADLADPVANACRAQLLREARGYGANRHLFRNFPPKVLWRRVELAPEDLIRSRYGRHRAWLTLSEGSRWVVDGAKNILKVPTEVNTHILSVARMVQRGVRFPELILVSSHDDHFILVEGHTRATAHLVAGTGDSIPVLLGSSPRLSEWIHY